jgi:hypothetical protein
MLGDLLFPGSPWLFPTRANKDDPKRRIRHGQLIPTQVWRERSLPSETGHILRHTYRTIAQRIALDKIEARLLLDHTVPGIDGVYIHEKALFDRLLEAQERMSAAISQLRQPESVSAKPTLWLVDEVKRNAGVTQRDEQNRSSAPPDETP